jgi:hypothetical protein
MEFRILQQQMDLLHDVRCGLYAEPNIEWLEIRHPAFLVCGPFLKLKSYFLERLGRVPVVTRCIYRLILKRRSRCMI